MSNTYKPHYLRYVLMFLLTHSLFSSPAVAQGPSETRWLLLKDTAGQISNLTTVVAWLDSVLTQNSQLLGEKSRSHSSFLDVEGTQHFIETVAQARRTQQIARAHLEAINLLTRANVIFLKATETTSESRILEFKLKLQELEARALVIRTDIETLVGVDSGGGLSDPEASIN